MIKQPIVVTKRSKSGDKEVDISPLVKSADVAFADGHILIKALLSCDSANYLNPEYVVRAIAEKFGIDFEAPATEYYSIMRKRVTLADGVTDFR